MTCCNFQSVKLKLRRKRRVNWYFPCHNIGSITLFDGQEACTYSIVIPVKPGYDWLLWINELHLFCGIKPELCAIDDQCWPGLMRLFTVLTDWLNEIFIWTSTRLWKGPSNFLTCKAPSVLSRKVPSADVSLYTQPRGTLGRERVKCRGLSGGE